MWGKARRKAGPQRSAGLFFDDSRITVASVDQARHLTVSYGERAYADQSLNYAFAKAEHANDKSAALTSVLPFGSYQLLQVDLPDVPQAELKDAVKWQIRDLLDFPAEEAVIELFDIPEQSNPGKQRTAYAVAARKSMLQQHVDALHSAGLRPDAIDIPELCLRNVAALLPQDKEGVAMLYFAERKGMLIVSRQGRLYFIRHMSIGTDELADSDMAFDAASGKLSSVILDVKRSLDYYESHYDRRPVTELVLAPGPDLGSLPAMLRDQLGLNVTRLGLAELFELQTDLPAERHGECLLAIGAALRTNALAA